MAELNLIDVANDPRIVLENVPLDRQFEGKLWELHGVTMRRDHCEVAPDGVSAVVETFEESEHDLENNL